MNLFSKLSHLHEPIEIYFYMKASFLPLLENAKTKQINFYILCANVDHCATSYQVRSILSILLRITFQNDSMGFNCSILCT